MVSNARKNATPASRTPIRIEASASHMGSPVTWEAITPARAATSPPSAALSSNRMTRSAASLVSRTERQTGTRSARPVELLDGDQEREELEDEGSRQNRHRDEEVFHLVGMAQRVDACWMEKTEPPTNSMTATMKLQK